MPLNSPVYVLGTGLSHNGSAVLLKDGKICVAIEKERITRRKRDGKNDSDAIRYCLEAEKITLDDIAVVVQCANFEIPNRDFYSGKRIFAETSHPPLVSISHHLAHAYSAAGTCPFDECAIMVMDGAGSPFRQCMDTHEGEIAYNGEGNLFHCEKNSFYHFDGQKVTTLLKDFSEIEDPSTKGIWRMQTVKHSIGGFYASISNYIFGNMDDAGKLMGLAPYGDPSKIDLQAFELENGNITVTGSWRERFNQPAENYEDFKSDFQYYADLAAWAQQEVEKAVLYCFKDRLSRFPHRQVCYSGGVALNAVANYKLLEENIVEELYLEPAAGDNGLALGCAFYGWMEVLGQRKVPHDGSTCFGKSYADEEISSALEGTDYETLDDVELYIRVAKLLAGGKTVGWFQQGSEFGPRALGRRSILAHPSVPGLSDHINRNIKFREDFRPFAPAVLPEYAGEYFVSGRKSPYMILVDRTRPEHLETLRNVTHVNGTARVQTADKSWNPRFEKLLRHFHKESGIPVLLNTSFNKKGMPIVERPEEAYALFRESALDVLVIENKVLVKKETESQVSNLKFQIKNPA